MSPTEKLFAIFIAVVTFGAAIFHTLLTYVPVFAHMLEPHVGFLSTLAIGVLTVALIVVLALLIHRRKHTD